MRVYYLQSEYEPGKHKILKVYSEYVDRAMPEDSTKTAINVPYTVLEIDERYNRWLCRQLLSNSRTIPNGQPLPDKYYVGSDGKLHTSDGALVVIVTNPQKEAYKISALYNMTQAQLEAYIDNQVSGISNLAQAKTVFGTLLKKMAAIELWLAKQSRLDE